MTPPRCEPPPEHQDKRWHWLARGDERWVQLWLGTEWEMGIGALRPETMAYEGYTYLSPLLTPAEVDALRERSVEPLPEGWHVSSLQENLSGWTIRISNPETHSFGNGPTINAACRAAIAKIGSGK